MAAPDVTDRSINPAQAPPPPPGAGAGGHQKLLAMVQGLSVGLSAAGAAISSHGREGGAPAVQEYYQKQQQAQQQAAAAQQALKNQQIQNQLTTAETSRVNGQNMLLFGTMHDEQLQSHFKTQEAGIDTQEKAQNMFDTTGRVPTGWSVDEQTGQVKDANQAAPAGQAPAGGAPAAAAPTPGNASTPNVLPGVTPGAPAPVAAAPAGPSIFDRRQGMILQFAGQKLGADDPDVKAAQAILADPKSTASQKRSAVIQIQNKAGMQEDAVKDLMTKADLQGKQEANIAALRPKDLNDAIGRVAQADQNYRKNPTPETKEALDNAKTARALFQSAEREKKQVDQDVQNGDPDVIGRMLASGTAAPSQVQSARSMSKPFYSKVLQAANQYAKDGGAPEILGPNGEHTGQYFNEATAESQYAYSKNIATQNTLNKIRTLNEPGGDLDILKDAVTALPKMDSATANKIFNATATEFGSSEATGYHMALYNLASLLATVQTGGIPTEGEIQTQLNLMKDSFSKGQLDTAINTARRDIAARGKSIVGNNPFLKNAYPDLANSGNPTPQSHIFDSKAWATANPGKDVNAAIAAAKQQGYEVR